MTTIANGLISSTLLTLTETIFKAYIKNIHIVICNYGVIVKLFIRL